MREGVLMRWSYILKIFLLLSFVLISSSFSATVQTKTKGRVIGEVQKIDSEGVVVLSKLGTLSINRDDIEYVLFSDDYRAYVGIKGIVLTNGIVVYGVPQSITSESGMLFNNYGTIELNLKNIAYFSYLQDETANSTMERLSQLNYADMLFDFCEEIYVYLVSDSVVKVDSLFIIKTDNGIFYEFSQKTDFGEIKYNLKPGYLKVIVYPISMVQRMYLVELNNSAMVLGEPIFKKDGILLKTPDGTEFSFYYDDVARILDISSLTSKETLTNKIEVLTAVIHEGKLIIELFGNGLKYNGVVGPQMYWDVK